MDPSRFIRANTRLLAVPLVPEIRLHLASESLPIWQRTEEELGAMNVPPPYWAFALAGGQALARHLLDNPGIVAGRSERFFAFIRPLLDAMQVLIDEKPGRFRLVLTAADEVGNRSPRRTLGLRVVRLSR